MPRLNLSDAETEQLILDHADRLFSEIGYDKTTVADIARACGFSSSNVHRVFGTKLAVKQAIAERKLCATLDYTHSAIAKVENASEKLNVFVRTVNAITHETFTERKRVHEMVAKAIDEKWDEVLNYRMGLRKTVRDIIALGVETGEFNVADIDQAAEAFHVSAIRFFHPHMVAEMEGEPDSGSIDVWLSFMLRALGTEPTHH